MIKVKTEPSENGGYFSTKMPKFTGEWLAAWLPSWGH